MPADEVAVLQELLKQAEAKAARVEAQPPATPAATPAPEAPAVPAQAPEIPAAQAPPAGIVAAAAGPQPPPGQQPLRSLEDVEGLSDAAFASRFDEVQAALKAAGQS